MPRRGPPSDATHRQCTPRQRRRFNRIGRHPTGRAHSGRRTAACPSCAIVAGFGAIYQRRRVHLQQGSTYWAATPVSLARTIPDNQHWVAITLVAGRLRSSARRGCHLAAVVFNNLDAPKNPVGGAQIEHAGFPLSSSKPRFNPKHGASTQIAYIAT